MSMNVCSIMGRLTKDPELRTTGGGTPVCSFTLAVDRDYGEDKQTDFIPVVAWKKTAEFVSKYFSKGRMACVTGRLQLRDYEDKDGIKRRVAEIVANSVYFADSKREADAAPADAAPAEFVPVEDDGLLPF